MTTYKPGTVAVATVRGVPNVRVFRYREGSWVTSEPLDGTRVHHGEDVTDVRPLVVLDLGDNPSYVTNLLRRVVEEGGLGAHTFFKLADQIEAQTRPPKPEEPTGLGAVVETPGGRYVRSDVETCNPWRGPNGVPFEWDDLDGPLRILSAGVSQ